MRTDGAARVCGANVGTGVVHERDESFAVYVRELTVLRSRYILFFYFIIINIFF